MPVQRCTKNGESGWKWGESGKCYIGSGAKAKAARQGAAIKATGYQEHNDMNVRERMLLQVVTTNFTGVVRNDTMEGHDYLVAPMIMIVEGVHEGSNGPLYYPANELAKTPAIWNYKPVVVYHPQANGVSISACDPDILTNRKVGVIMNTSIGLIDVLRDKKKVKVTALKAEAWLEVDRMNKVDERIAEAIEKNEVMELSTGVFIDNEDTEGEWNGEHYDAIARNYRPDHLALLPDLVGACSVEDGAGFLRLNEQQVFLFDKKKWTAATARDWIKNHKPTTHEISFDDVRRRIQSILREKFEEEEYIYVEEVYDDYFVYERTANLYKQEYDDVNGSISFKGLPIVVVKQTSYVTKNERKKAMNKVKLVETLIENKGTQWSDDDKDVLMALEEGVLEKMTPVKNEDEDDENNGNKKTEVAATAEKGAEDVAASKQEGEGEKSEGEEETAVENMTAEDYIDKKVPAELKGVLRSGLASYNATKDRLIDIITSNEKNVFTKEQLGAKDLDELKSLTALAMSTSTDEQKKKAETLNNYAGQGDPIHDEGEEEPMDVPALNFDNNEK